MIPDDMPIFAKLVRGLRVGRNEVSAPAAKSAALDAIDGYPAKLRPNAVADWSYSILELPTGQGLMIKQQHLSGINLRFDFSGPKIDPTHTVCIWR